MLNYNRRFYLPSELYTLNKSTITDDLLNYSSTAAYIINKDGANIILNKIYKNNRFILKKNYLYYADVYIYNLLNAYVYFYPYFIYKTNNDSDISNCSDSIEFQNLSKKSIFYITWGRSNIFTQENISLYIILLLIILVILVFILIIRGKIHILQ